jgi:hypothetical protein
VNRLTCAWLLAALISLTARAPLSATDASTPPPPAPSATPDPITATGGNGQAVIGGAVRGGATYGTFPLHQLSGPDDAGDRGNWIPTTSLDQYAATLGSWFDVPDADLRTIFPNPVRLSPARLGFL